MPEPTWEEITQTEKFQRLPEEQKRIALTGWMKRTLEAREDYQNLPPMRKEKAWKIHEEMAGLLPQERMFNIPEESFFKKFARGAVKSLPAAGGMAGGMGGGVLAALPPSPSSPIRAKLGAVAGAGLGGSAGESLKQMISQNLFNEMALPGESGYGKIAQSGVEQATMEMGGQVLTLGLGKLLAPGAKNLTAKNLEDIRFAKENNLPVSPSSLTTTKLAKRVTKATDSLPPGDFVIAQQRKKVAAGITKMRDNFISDVLDLPPSAGQEEFKQQAKEIYGKLAEEAGGKNAKYAMENVSAYLDDSLDDMVKTLGRNKKNKDFFRMIQRKLQDTGKIEWDEIQNLTAKKWSGGWSKLKPEHRPLWKGFTDAVDKDLLAVDEAANINITGMLKDAGRLYKSSSDAAKSRQIEYLFKRSMRDVEGTEVLMPEQFQRNLESSIPRLQKSGLPADKIKLLRKFAEKIQVAAPDIKKFVEGKSIGAVLKKGALGSGALGALYKEPMLAVPMGADAIFAYAIMNPKWFMKTWLTTGYTPGFGSELLKQSLKPIPQLIRDLNEQQEQDNGTETGPGGLSPQQFINR